MHLESTAMATANVERVIASPTFPQGFCPSQTAGLPSTKTLQKTNFGPEADGQGWRTTGMGNT